MTHVFALLRQNSRLYKQNHLKLASSYRFQTIKHSISTSATQSANSAPTMSVSNNDNNTWQQAQDLVPKLTHGKYKGQAGKIAVIGGCREYTGAPYFSAISALRVGADLSHVFCTEGAATVIKSYSPELIVHPYLPETIDQLPNASASIIQWIDKFDALVIGPGLGREDAILSCVADVIKNAREKDIPMIIDADGLWLINKSPELIQGYKRAILTPNAAEFRRLQDLATKNNNSHTMEDSLGAISRWLNGPVIFKKAATDVITSGTLTVECSEEGSLRRAGGQGDVLSGCIATFVAWAVKGGALPSSSSRPSSAIDDTKISKVLIAAGYGGAIVTRRASKKAFAVEKRAMGATHVIAHLGRAVEELFD